MKIIKFFLIIFFMILVIGCGDVQLENTENEVIINVNSKEARKLIKEDDSLIILDVRTRMEYNIGHIKNAINIPIDELELRLEELDKDIPILVYCKSGNRSSTVARILSKKNFIRIYNLLGGLEKWEGELVND